MNSKKWTTTVAAALIVLLATSAQAQLVPPPDFQLTVQLQATRTGATCGSSGWATIGRKAGIEVFRIVLFTKHVDNTEMLVVGLNDQEQWFKIGAVKITMGTGELEIWQPTPPDASQIFPITRLKRIAVYERGTMLLRGTFNPLSG